MSSVDTQSGNHSETTPLTADAVRRIGRDVKDVLRDPHENIVYIHSAEKVNVGYAMVVGTCDTPYFCVPMFYRIEFPSDYPHSPPKMSFLTHSSPNGVSVRMHPNYYVNGKCCLSILNSWSGEKWTGCQTLRSLLMTILMTLTGDPLTNEPGHSNHSKTHDAYRAVVTEAGLHWITKVVSDEAAHAVRFSKNDGENQILNQRFRHRFIEDFIQNKDYGQSILIQLNQYEDDEHSSNMYSKFIKEHDNKCHYVTCYRGEYSIDFAKARAAALHALTAGSTTPDSDG